MNEEFAKPFILRNCATYRKERGLIAKLARIADELSPLYFRKLQRLGYAKVEPWEFAIADKRRTVKGTRANE